MSLIDPASSHREFKSLDRAAAYPADLSSRVQVERSPEFPLDRPPADPVELYRALVISSPEGIFIGDMHGVIRFASPSALKIMELNDESQVLGTQVLDWVDPEDQERMAGHLRDAALNIFAEDSLYRFHTASGRHFIGEINAALLHDATGAVTGLMANLRDVTDRFMANEALAMSEGKLRRMVQASPVGMHFYRLEPGGRLVLEDTNPAADRILGIAHAPLIGKPIEEAFPGLAETSIPAEFRRLAADGGQWQTEQIVYEQGEINGVFAVVAFQITHGHMISSFTDVTRRWRAEQELRNSEAQLRQKEAELRQSEAELRQREAELQQSEAELRKSEEELRNSEDELRRSEATLLVREETLRKIAIDLHESNTALRASIAHEQLLRTLDKLIIENDDLEATVSALMRPVLDYFKADAAEILAYRPDSHTFLQIAGLGFCSDQFRLPVVGNDGIAGLALSLQHTICAPDLFASDMRVFNSHFFLREKFVSGYAALLRTPSRIHGVFQLFFRHPTELTGEMVDFFEMVARQAAIAMEKASLWENHRKTLSELVDAYSTTLEGWVYALDLRDKETEDHTRRVTQMTVAVAEAFNTDPATVAAYRRGALLHDIGKIGIPDSILHKPGPLTADEWTIMRQHPQFAHDMLEPIAYLRSAIAIPYCHHERWDGSGYPRGLQGDAIPLEARIFAVVDVWDALTSDRPYRPAWTKEKARAYLMDNSGILFDPEAVAVFFEIFKI